ncbi:hypothetical protein WT92_25160 [Burkholderia stagnalis]|uniref:Uncharacterized protein n=1 Tax=Burkholderia stagnalis TaxID=1503054 RepID=A0A119H1Z3_9BURK|nr:hypothetical protein WT35_28090 [Burkholderia stagnalis]KWA51691.1 hypothetical protein WT42_16565 [Burkholderia stagnalis]KWA62672.1 hypothetical protein WT44_13665 [Burkholderia stagnalis]KWC98311.1 hypothetical protein WT46_23650 [Burkholderia stagnalis]KWD07204.1 hypothetical protein WT45_03160 [Burkholderia stagnalis]
MRFELCFRFVALLSRERSQGAGREGQQNGDLGVMVGLSIFEFAQLLFEIGGGWFMRAPFVEGC